MTSKPDSVSTLGYHWTYRTGRPLEPQVHWDATGTTLADASTQWCSSGDPVLICIIGTHWKTTGKPLEDHGKHTGISPVAFQCTLGSKFQAHWIATGLPLEDHWLRVRDGTFRETHVNNMHKNYPTSQCDIASPVELNWPFLYLLASTIVQPTQYLYWGDSIGVVNSVYKKMYKNESSFMIHHRLKLLSGDVVCEGWHFWMCITLMYWIFTHTIV